MNLQLALTKYSQAAGVNPAGQGQARQGQPAPWQQQPPGPLQVDQPAPPPPSYPAYRPPTPQPAAPLPAPGPTAYTPSNLPPDPRPDRTFFRFFNPGRQTYQAPDGRTLVDDPGIVKGTWRNLVSLFTGKKYNPLEREMGNINSSYQNAYDDELRMKMQAARQRAHQEARAQQRYQLRQRAHRGYYSSFGTPSPYEQASQAELQAGRDYVYGPQGQQ